MRISEKVTYDTGNNRLDFESGLNNGLSVELIYTFQSIVHHQSLGGYLSIDGVHEVLGLIVSDSFDLT